MVDMFRVSGFMYMSDPPHGMLILDLNAGGSPASYTVTAPVLTVVTDNATYPPQIDAALSENTLVGDTARLQYSHDATFLTGVTTVDHVLVDMSPVSYSLTGIVSGTNRFRASIIRAGAQVSNWSDIVTHGPDDLAPVINSATALSTGTTTATLGVTTDTGEGTIYFVVVLTNSQPSKAQIKAGQNSAGAAAAKTASIAPTTTGTKTVNVTGLTSATTYYVFVMHEDVAGNQSNVVGSSAITTDTAPPFDISEVYAPAFVISPGGTSYTFTAASLGAADSTRTIYVAVDFDNGSGALSGLTIAGISATKLADNFTTTQGYLYKLDVPAGTTGDIVIGSATAFNHVAIKVWRAVGAGTAVVVKPNDGTFDQNNPVSGTIVAGGGGIVFSGIKTITGTPSWSNATAVSTTKGDGWTFMSAFSITASSPTISYTGFSGFPQCYAVGVFIPPA